MTTCLLVTGSNTYSSQSPIDAPNVALDAAQYKFIITLELRTNPVRFRGIAGGSTWAT